MIRDDDTRDELRAVISTAPDGRRRGQPFIDGRPGPSKTMATITGAERGVRRWRRVDETTQIALGGNEAMTIVKGEYLIALDSPHHVRLPVGAFKRHEELIIQARQRDGRLRIELIKRTDDLIIDWQLELQLAEPVPVTDDEFNRLISEGALNHPLAMFRLMRAYLALRYLIDAVPGAASALREWARQRDARDAAGEEPV